MDCGKRLKQLRQEADLSIRELAEMTGESSSSLCRWENGESRIPLFAILNIAKALNIPVSSLVEVEQNEGAIQQDFGCSMPEKSAAESCIHVLRGLISYHERMTMGNYPERDFYLDALKYALECVEEKKNREGGE